MIDSAVFTGYNLVVGVLTGIGVSYFLFIKPTIVRYHRFLVVTIGGLFLFLIGGPITELLYPTFVHWVHGIAALFVILGLYDPIEKAFRHEAWADVLLRDPCQVRQPEDWMLPIDDEIIGLFQSVGLVLTPSIIAYNIDYSRDEVNRRLIELEQRGFVTKVERGKYQITELGIQYVNGPVLHSPLSQLHHIWDGKFSK